MRWSSVVLALLATTQIVSCDPLDKSENEQRFQACGKKMTSKVYMGTEAQQSEAPWSVFFLLYNKEENSATTCTGTIVSPRHVLIATHCFVELNGAQWELEGKQLDTTHCKNGDYVITDDDILKRIRIKSDKKVVSRHPEKVTLVKACVKRSAVKTANYNNTQYYTDDFAIIDLYDDLKSSSTIQHVCVAGSVSENAAGTELDYFGYGLNPPKDQRSDEAKDNTGVLRHETVKVIDQEMEDYYFLARDPNSITVACVGDSGGGAVKDVNGQKTIVGVLSQTNCVKPKNRNKAMEQYASVGYYNEDICRLTGICDDTPKHDKYHKDYTRKPKPLRPTEPPLVAQRPVGIAAVDPNGTTGKSPAPRNQEATEEPIDSTQDAPEEQSSSEVDPNGANSGFFHAILVLISMFVML